MSRARDRADAAPVIVVTMGDPAGIGPEISVSALSDRQVCGSARLVLIGDYDLLARARHLVPAHTPLHRIHTIGDWVEGSINIVDIHAPAPPACTVGAVQSACGKASYDYVLHAIHWCLSHRAAGMVTNPISKEALSAAGIPFLGHTEILAHETKTPSPAMVVMLEEVYVAHVTAHCAVSAAVAAVTARRVAATIATLNDSLRSIGIESPRIAVGGLNPHAGENCLLGTEERDHIVPAIREAQEKGLTVTGPYPPDTVFMRAFRGEFDGVVAMLHDHGFVALKSRSFEHCVHITMGLPIIRTSVGHGTAFDIAGRGIASAQSLKNAIAVCKRLIAAKAENSK